MNGDYHVHSTYSDGDFLVSMCRAAVDAGLDAIGVADHCNVSSTDTLTDLRDVRGYNLDLTYQRRRGAIQRLNDRFDLTVYDAVEMDYEPADEAEIAAFLDRAEFDYTVGSVHHLDGVNVHNRPHFESKSRTERETLVERYFEKLIALIDSELFDVVAHPGLVERNPVLRGLASSESYERVAEAFATARAVPELNAGAGLDQFDELLPQGSLRAELVSRGVAFVAGTDSHESSHIAPRTERIKRAVDADGLRLAHPIDGE